MPIKLFKFKSGDKSGIGCEYKSGNYNFKKIFMELFVKSYGNNDLTSALNVINRNKEKFDKHLDQIISSKEENSFSMPDKWEFDIPLVPSKIIAVGRNFADHAKEGGHKPPDEPMLFAKLQSTMIAHQQTVLLPPGVGRVDHEIELTVIIGKTAKNVDKDSALSYVAGYTIFNDITARDMQKADVGSGKPYMRSKGFDTFGPCGPYVTPACYIDDPQELKLNLKVNEEEKQSASTADMLFPVDVLISYITSICTLVPGDMIITGTPAGVSPLKPGDIITAEIEKIGILINPVA